MCSFLNIGLKLECTAQNWTVIPWWWFLAHSPSWLLLSLLNPMCNPLCCYVCFLAMNIWPSQFLAWDSVPSPSFTPTTPVEYVYMFWPCIQYHTWSSLMNQAFSILWKSSNINICSLSPNTNPSCAQSSQNLSHWHAQAGCPQVCLMPVKCNGMHFHSSALHASLLVYLPTFLSIQVQNK